MRFGKVVRLLDIKFNLFINRRFFSIVEDFNKYLVKVGLWLRFKVFNFDRGRRKFFLIEFWVIVIFDIDSCRRFLRLLKIFFDIFIRCNLLMLR